MINKIINFFNNNKILILGLGREGQSSYKLIRKHLPQLMIGVADAKEINLSENKYLNDDKFVKFHFGEGYLNAIEDYDLILKSPGISFKNIDTERFRGKLTSQTDLFLRFASQNVIGVTGTKGKSTTSSLIKHIISISNPDVKLIGNIGVPPFEVLEQIDENTQIVFELSSHQLEYVSHSPRVAVLLNIYEEHLDHYNSYKDYQEAKINICRFQNKDDYFVYNAENPIISEFVKNNGITHQKIPVSFDVSKIGENGIFEDDGFVTYRKDRENLKVFDTKTKSALLGKHNLFNIMSVIAVCKILNVSENDISKGISTFKGLPHRLEFVGEFDGVYYYNDSIATIPEAAISAIESIENVDTLIAGGFDRGISYEEFGKYLDNSKVRNIILLPSTGEIIYEFMKKYRQDKLEIHKIYFAEKLTDAVKIAKEVTEKGKVCLFSPAAASYGFFKNFEQRGDMFKELVRAQLKEVNNVSR